MEIVIVTLSSALAGENVDEEPPLSEIVTVFCRVTVWVPTADVFPVIVLIRPGRELS